MDLDRSERFVIRGKLGAGGMGVVYEAFDRQRNHEVAIKTLRRMNAATLYRFKNEFRALAGISHPNLITLHELMTVGGEWLFTMELVRGCTFLEHVRPNESSIPDDNNAPPTPSTVQLRPHRPDQDATEAQRVQTVDTSTAPSQINKKQAGPATRPCAVDIARLRASLCQLAQGVEFLHQSGRLHRDIKPSNILIGDNDGRVVLCDFGLVANVENGTPYITESRQVTGTLAYMSPEQASLRPLTIASDWYSVGVVLYQALTGEVPFAAWRADLLMLKTTKEPPPAIELAPKIPVDLSELCVDLLRLNPAHRPLGADVLRRLGGRTEAALVSSAAFVGRASHLAALHSALDEVREGQTSVVFVSGQSGMGKTTLVKHFLDEVEQTESVLVFSGRCYEREALPYKALDSLIDNISSFLARLSDARVEALLPDDISALSRVFPVLRRVDAIAAPQLRSFNHQSPHELRRRGLLALRELLARLADDHLIVLFIDDLQWGDQDSGHLLAELMQPPEPPRILLIGTYRSEDEGTSPMLCELLGTGPEVSTKLDHHRIALDPLSNSEAAELARVLVGDIAPDGYAAAIASESGGDPLLAAELVRHFGTRSRDQTTDPTVHRLTIAEMLKARIADLAPDAHEIISLLAVAGRPTTVRLLGAAAAAPGNLTAAIAGLQAAKLARLRPGPKGDLLETTHDRISETLVGTLPPPQLRDQHRRLARALQLIGEADPDALVEHWLGADDQQRAASAAIAAAKNAARALAFERAAKLYDLALKHAPDEATEDTLREQLGDALANAGRGAEAARVYLSIADETNEFRALELRRRAALELLRSGRVDQGRAVLRDVMQAVGIRIAHSPRRAVFNLVTRHTFTRMRGYGFRRRSPQSLPADQLARIDVCWTAAVGLGMIDTVRGAEAHSKHLLLALRAGEPERVARALSIEVAFLSSVSPRGVVRAEKLITQTAALVDELGKPELEAWLGGTSALAAYHDGRFELARQRAQNTVTIIRDRCPGMEWELVSSQLYVMWSLFYLGRTRDMATSVHNLRRAARRRGDLYASISLRTGHATTVELFADKPRRAQDHVSYAMLRWTDDGFHLQHYWALLSLAQRDLYAGEGTHARQRINTAWPALAHSYLLRIQVLRLEVMHLRARACVAAAAQAETAAAKKTLIAEAERTARKIAREKTHWATPLAEMIFAAIAWARGDEQRAMNSYAAAAAGAEVADLLLYRTVAHYRQGQLIGGDEGNTLISTATQYMRSQGIVAPERVVDMLAPERVVDMLAPRA